MDLVFGVVCGSIVSSIGTTWLIGYDFNVELHNQDTKIEMVLIITLYVNGRAC